MSKKDEQILQEVEYLQDRYFTFDDPIPFCGLMLYPVLTRYYNEFMSCSSCLTLNKNDTFAGIKTTHLGFLLNQMNGENKEESALWTFKFSRLMELIFHIKNGLKCPKCGKLISYNDLIERINAATQSGIELTEQQLLACDEEGCDGVYTEMITYRTDSQTKRPELVIDGHIINSDDFARLRKIVMYQNLPDFKDDSWVDKSIRDDQAEKQRILSKGSGTATLERKLVCITAKSNYTLDALYDMSMRKMLMLFEVIQDAMEYEISKTGLMSGMVSLKKGEKLEHWIYKKDSGLYGAAVDANSYRSQVQGS